MNLDEAIEKKEELISIAEELWKFYKENNGLDKHNEALCFYHSDINKESLMQVKFFKGSRKEGINKGYKMEWNQYEG